MFSFRAISVSKVLSKHISQNTGIISILSRKMSSVNNYQFEHLNVTKPRDYVFQVEMNRPEKRNAMNMKLFSEIKDCFNQLSSEGDCRAVVLSGAGKMFTAGIDLMALVSGIGQEEEEVARKSLRIRRFGSELQECMTAVEKCHKPVIAAVHNACIGAGVDLITACDIRYCSRDAYFQIKEVDVGLAADIGTLQRLPKIVGNDSLARELAYTARKMFSDEAKELGLVSRIFPDRESLLEGCLDIGELIASKSPVAVQGSKINLVYSRDHSVAEGLNFVITWNQAMLQSEDTVKAAMASMSKEKPVFSKL